MLNEESVYDKPDYAELKAFNDELLNENSPLGKIISSENIRKGSQNIERAIALAIVRSGNGVWVGQVPL